MEPVIEPVEAIEPVAVVTVAKRRGRKPKESNVASTSSAKVSSIIDSLNGKKIADEIESSQDHNAKLASHDTNMVAPPKKEKEKGKRGRKPKYVYASNDDIVCDDVVTINVNNTSDDENIIVRLNVNDSGQFTSNQDITFEDEQPYAYNHDTYNNIPLLGRDENSSPNNSTFMPTNTIGEHVKVVSILKDFEEKNKHNEWPSNTSISCYWCCHRFDNAPFGIPINYANDIFEVFGCFCSLECAAAYNFSTSESQDEVWERYQLINMLCRKMKIGKVVKPAPPRLSLKMFGGHMEIEQFRSFGSTHKFVNINFPPMTSVTQQLEEINDFELCNEVKYIPIDNERVNKYKEKITFRRNKPLVDSNKSLESTMNLKYS